MRVQGVDGERIWVHFPVLKSRGREYRTILDTGSGRAENDLAATDPGESNAVLITYDQPQGSDVSCARCR